MVRDLCPGRGRPRPSHAIIRLWHVHSCCSPTAAVFESWHVLCSLCLFFSFFFSQKNTGGALQCDGAVMHNSSSEHSTAVGHTRYSAAPAQPYNFDAAPAQQYSPRVSPPPTRWPARNNSRRLTNPRQLPQKVKQLTNSLAWLAGLPHN